MFKKWFLLLLVISRMAGFAQINQGQDVISNRFTEENDSLKFSKPFKVKLSDKTHYTDYKIISLKNDTTYVDTTLNISKYYKFNFLRQDVFGLQPFENMGQTFNALTYEYKEVGLYPAIGARAKHYGYYEVEDIDYYEVPTPTTILMYRTGMQQGQVLDAFFTFNYTKRFNASVAFKGLHSLGDYRHASSDGGSMRLTMSYHTLDEKYQIRAHIVAQKLENDENGGLTEVSMENFESGSPNFKDRARLETRFTDAMNTLRGNRYFFEQTYSLWKKKDSAKSKTLSDLRIGHQFNYERKHYSFEQSTANSFFGEAFIPSVNDDAKFSKLYNEVFADFTSPYILGNFRVSVNDYLYDYGYKNMLISDDQVIHSRMKGNVMGAGAEWQAGFHRFNLHAKASTTFAGSLNANYIAGDLSFAIDSISSLYAGISTNTRSPNFNFLMFQSTYKSYNWQTDYKNQGIHTLYGGIRSKKWLDASVQQTSISSYTYFDAPGDDGQTHPRQYDKTVQYFKVQVGKEFRLGKFALDNTLVYQNVMQGGDVFRVPQFITRNSLYFTDYLFKGDPLYLQTGITFNYFTKYYMNAYNPLLAEFYLQNDRELGGYPMFDFFINAEISRVRIYLLFEHFNADFTGYNYYSAPTYPYRDFKVRFGLVWNFFI